jgi:hypothetical protein
MQLQTMTSPVEHSRMLQRWSIEDEKGQNMRVTANFKRNFELENGIRDQVVRATRAPQRGLCCRRRPASVLFDTKMVSDEMLGRLFEFMQTLG